MEVVLCFPFFEVGEVDHFSLEGREEPYCSAFLTALFAVKISYLFSLGISVTSIEL